MKKLLAVILTLVMLLGMIGSANAVNIADISGEAFDLGDVNVDTDVSAKASSSENYVTKGEVTAYKMREGKDFDFRCVMDLANVKLKFENARALAERRINARVKAAEGTPEEKEALKAAYLEAYDNLLIIGYFDITVNYDEGLTLPEMTHDMLDANETIFTWEVPEHNEAEREITLRVYVLNGITSKDIEERLFGEKLIMTCEGVTADEVGTYVVSGTMTGTTDVKEGEIQVAKIDYVAVQDDKDPEGNLSATVVVKQTSGGSSEGGGTTPKYTLSYDTNGGSSVPSSTHNKNSLIPLDTVPVREGYIFEGWYLDEELTNKTDSVYMTKDVTVYAAWVMDNGSAGSGHEPPQSLNSEDHFAYIMGYPDGTVKPNNNITRAEVTTIFFRLLKEDIREDNLSSFNVFADVDEDDWFNAAVSTMAELGIVKGRTETYFAPNANITRAEFAAICARFDDSEYEKGEEFDDVSGHWAEDYIKEAAARGWIRGYEDGTFKPDRPITRAEAMTMINRVLNRVPETYDDLLTEMIRWSDNSNRSAWYYIAVQEATNSHDYEKKNSIYEKWTKINSVTDWTKYED